MNQRGEATGATTLARIRWKLLAKVLNKTGRKHTVPRCLLVPTTSRELYGVFEWTLSDDSDVSGQWVQCRPFHQPLFRLNIRFLTNGFSMDEITGFNNTGNVCIWPSEEVLAYYCTNNGRLFSNKRVLELGGGMTCLAGLAVAKTCEPLAVMCTDGNATSVGNVQRILEQNSFTASVAAQVLDWSKPNDVMQFEWDVVLCADCLFFDDGRQPLVDTLMRVTTDGGLILIMAPRRGHTLDAFLDLCHGKFDIDVQEEFDSNVILSHQKKSLCSPSYNADHNYPLLVRLTKC